MPVASHPHASGDGRSGITATRRTWLAPRTNLTAKLRTRSLNVAEKSRIWQRRELRGDAEALSSVGGAENAGARTIKTGPHGDEKEHLGAPSLAR